MNKIDRDAFHKWDSSRAKTAHANIQAWEAACTYKDKRIAELKEALMTIGNALAMED